MNNSTEKKKEQCVNLLNNFANYQHHNININNISEIYNSIIECVNNLEFVNSVAIFSLNFENFEFQFEVASHVDKIIIYNSLYDKLLFNNTIGAITKNKDIARYSASKKEEYILFPLISLDNIIAILIIEIHDKSILCQEAQQIIKMWLSQQALFIENIKFKNQYLLENSRLEQSMALSALTINKTKSEIEQILESIQVAVLIINPSDMTISSINSYATELINDSKDSIINTKYDKYIPEANNINLDHGTETFLITSDRMPIPVMRYSVKTKLMNNNYIIETLTDIRKHKSLEISLKNNNKQLEERIKDRTTELNRSINRLHNEIKIRERVEQDIRQLLEQEKEFSNMKSRFVSIVSHEFRTPLTVINSVAQILDNFYEQLSSEERHEYLSKIQNNVHDMIELMENVLFIGKTDLVKGKINLNNHNILDIINDIIKDITYHIDDKSFLNLTSDLISGNIYTDDKIFRQVFQNILSNAIKFSGENRKIDINITENNNSYTIIIKDNGIGIPQEELSQIFKQFYRASNASEYRGSGLGMTIIKRSLDILSSKLDITSKLNKGTTITIDMPKNVKAK